MCIHPVDQFLIQSAAAANIRTCITLTRGGRVSVEIIPRTCVYTAKLLALSISTPAEDYIILYCNYIPTHSQLGHIRALQVHP